MAKKEQQKSPHETKYKSDYQSDWSVHKDYIERFDSYEAMLVGHVFDEVSHSVDSSKITDSYASTLAIERSARVMGKLPEGVVEAAAKSDQGKAAFMEILRQKWIYPNANAQHPFFTKLRLWQLYSSVYGYMPMFYDWNVSPNGHLGPDCWLWNPRNFVPQQGKTSIEDMEYVTALTWVSKKFLKSKLEDEDGGWNADALQELIDLAENATSDHDTHQDTHVHRTRTTSGVKKGILLATRYEAGDAGEWITFAPDHSFVEIRRIKNPHKNGKIPFVIKYSQPLFDSFYGMGDFQRAKPLQFARDGLTNFYFRGIKMNLIPPLVVNANGVVKHTIDYREGSVMQETLPNSIRQLPTSTAGLSTYQAVQTSLTGSLLSLYGTQNASIPGAEALNPSQGKTPAAIEMYSGKEATRDGQERAYLEQAIEQLTDGFFSLIINVGTEEIPVNLFAEDIEAIIKAGLEDVLGIFTKKFKPNETLTGGELKIDPKKLKNAEYRFNITPGSTAKVTEEGKLVALEKLMDTLAKYQNILQEDPRIEIRWGDMLEAYENLSNIAGASEFVVTKKAPSPQEQELMEQNKQLEEGLVQAQEQMQQLQAQLQEAAARPSAMMPNGMQFQDPELGEAAQRLR